MNAARHGGAKTVAVSVTQADSDVTIAVRDDGIGFSFLGDYDHEALFTNRLGPLSLKHRVEEAGGRLHISSTGSGSVLTVRISVDESG